MTTAANEQVEQLSREELFALVLRQQEVCASGSRSRRSQSGAGKIPATPCDVPNFFATAIFGSENQFRSAEKEAKEETPGPRPAEAAAGGQSRSTRPGSCERMSGLSSELDEGRAGESHPAAGHRDPAGEAVHHRDAKARSSLSELPRAQSRPTQGAGLEADRFFGPNLAARVVYYKQTQHLSYERIFDALVRLMGKPIDRYFPPSSP
jgi:hypothetical protein